MPPRRPVTTTVTEGPMVTESSIPAGSAGQPVEAIASPEPQPRASGAAGARAATEPGQAAGKTYRIRRTDAKKSHQWEHRGRVIAPGDVVEVSEATMKRLIADGLGEPA